MPCGKTSVREPTTGKVTPVVGNSRGIPAPEVLVVDALLFFRYRLLTGRMHKPGKAMQCGTVTRGSVSRGSKSKLFIMLCSGEMPVFDTNSDWSTKEMDVVLSWCVLECPLSCTLVGARSMWVGRQRGRESRIAC